MKREQVIRAIKEASEDANSFLALVRLHVSVHYWLPDSHREFDL